METVIPNSPPAGDAAAPNGAMPPAGSRVTGLDLEAALSRLNPPASPEPGDSPTPPADGDPANPPAPPAGDAPGKTDLPADEPPAGDEPAGKTEPVLSQTDEQLNAAVQGLDPQLKEHLLKMVTERTGEIPRISKLIAEKHQAETTIEALQTQIEELQSGAGAPVQTPGTAAMPEAVAKLKTPQEVQARLQTVEATLDQLQDFLDANPGTADTVHKLGEKELTRQELLEWRAQLRGEAKALPQRGQQLARVTEFTQARKEASAKFVEEFPQLKDAENPDTKMARQLLKDARFNDVVEADYLALAMATGHRVLQAELATRKGGKGAAAPAASAKKPVGVVAAAKPHVNGGGAAPNGGSLKTFQAALPKAGAKVKGADLERVLAAMPGS